MIKIQIGLFNLKIS